MSNVDLFGMILDSKDIFLSFSLNHSYRYKKGNLKVQCDQTKIYKVFSFKWYIL